MSILVTYATAKGATSEIAERIAERLKAFAASVEVLPTKEVSAASLPTYSAIIVGSAIHVGSWLAPARHFIYDNSAALISQQVWAFSIGMPPNEEDRTNEERTMDGKIRKVLPDLRGHKLFQGRFEKQDLPWIIRIIFACCVPEEKTKWGDARNWEEIEAWSENVGREITSGRTMGTA
jgi:menaquinone-dependent protoporphyrinogen oxidase